MSFPCDQGECYHRGVAYGCVTQCEEPIVQPANQKKPTKAKRGASRIPPVRAKGFAQSLVMEHEECMVAKQKMNTTIAQRRRVIVKHSGQVPEVGDQERDAQQHRAPP